jgi:hypothetical protein
MLPHTFRIWQDAKSAPERGETPRLQSPERGIYAVNVVRRGVCITLLVDDASSGPASFVDREN